MPISWNEIKDRAMQFSQEWADETRERSEGKSFWDEFFQVFGIRRRTVASFEEPVKKLTGDWGFIDLFWPGMLLVEHKSRGKDLGQAESQAEDYIRALVNAGRADESPRYLMLSDFARLALHDLEEGTSIEFPLSDFHRHVYDFAFIPGYKQHTLEDEDPVNIRAVEIMGDLHDALAERGYGGHDLERFLVRVLFCLFAEDTGIFERNLFTLYVENHTKPDGSDVGMHLNSLFEILNTPTDLRQSSLDESLSAFPYVNGGLFEERLNTPAFTTATRETLLRCTRFDWSQISPAVFGSLFQSVLEPKERRQVGAHYTSERDILKVVRSLFLDELRNEFNRIKTNKRRLAEFHKKLGNLKFLDPACGCGNFLVVTYRELRRLEIEVLLAMNGNKQGYTDIDLLSLMNVDAMHGIEINEFPVRIAEVALWLVDHQMNLKLSEAFGQYFVRLPLKKSPKILHGNALRTDWNSLLPAHKCNYILGNPPYVGKKTRTIEQQKDMQATFVNHPASGLLDYVCCWYKRAADYIAQTSIRVGFVSTNSITQGEQPGILWPELFRQYGLKIHFAHRTFPWESEAKGKAHVHVVIIGFGVGDAGINKQIYEYEWDTDGKETKECVSVASVRNISPYLVEGGDVVLKNRSKPVCETPQMQFGNMPNDGGHLILTNRERRELLAQNSGLKPYIRPLLSAKEYLHGDKRWCLWLDDTCNKLIHATPLLKQRMEAVRRYRSQSKRETTRELAKYPMLFGEIRQPQSTYLLIPRHSAETREYIPLGFFKASTIVSDSCLFLPEADWYHFGVLSSEMHMAWVRQVCGRLESRFRYSVGLVYNNFPWPTQPTGKQLQAVKQKAKTLLKVRSTYHGVSLAELYTPSAMPPKLRRAHIELDRAVDKCYRAKPFACERERVEFLFARYERLTSPLAPSPKLRRATR